MSEDSTQDAPKVLIVDDHGLLAQSLTFSLRADGLQVERCRDLTERGILESVQVSQPDVVLLDLDLGGELGTSLPLISKVADYDAKVVMLTGVTDRVRLAECLELGAIGIIPKTDPFDDLIDGVKRAAVTGTVFTAAEREDYLADLRRHRASERERLRDFEQLTPREAQVLVALMDGRSAEQIAEEWVVSIATVRSQIRALLQKLGVNSQLSAVAYARKVGWTPEAN